MSESLEKSVLKANDLSVYYGDNKAVNSVNLNLESKGVYSLIGPSGCGKSTILRCFNRMNDFIPHFKITGDILYRGKDIYHKSIDPVIIRKKIGMVFQKPNPFPSSILKNITWGPKINGFDGDLDGLAKDCLKRASLWDEVKDRLTDSGLQLSGGQQQRLCIARTIAMSPEVILMDEPCASLDPVSTKHIEDLVLELKKKYTILIVTHSMAQAARLSDYTAFMYQGNLIEFDETKKIFDSPSEQLTKDYIQGKFG